MAGADEYDLVKPGEEETLAPGAEAKEAVGPFQRSDEELVKQLRAWFKEASDAKSEVALKRKKDWRMLAGDQWETADADVWDKQKRPRLTLNMLLTIIAAVEGEERTNRQEIKLYGQEKGDDPAAAGLNSLLKWVMDQCGGEFALSQMFRSDVACGEGWVVPEVNYFDDPEGKIELVFVDDDEAFPDPLDNDPAGRKSRYFNRVRMMEEDEIDARWPGKKKVLQDYCQAQGVGPETDGKGHRDIYSTPEDTKTPKLYDAQKRQWAVLETWWYQIEPGHVVVNEQTGLLEEMTAEELEALKLQRQSEQQAFMRAAMLGDLQPVQPAMQDPATGAITPPVMPTMPPPIQAQERPIKRFYQAFSCYDVLLDKMASPLKNLRRLPYVPARAIYDKVKQEWRGLIRDLIDPQRQHNVEQSVIVQLMQLMPKQAWMGPKGSFHNKQEWQEKIAQPGAMLEYNASRGKPEQITTPAIPRHLIDMAFSRREAMREISGVNTEMTGQRQGNDAGVVMEMRSKAARTVLAPIFDNFRMAKLEVGKVLLAYIQTYVKPGRRVRVLGEEGAQYVDMTLDMSLPVYDLKVEETNSTVNDRIATLNILQTTLPTLMKAGMTPPPEFIDLMPMPPHVRDQWKRQIAWEMTIAGKLPPAGWQPGMPIPLPGLPAPSPGAPAPAGPPQQ